MAEEILTNVFCILVLIVLLLGVYLQNKSKEMTTTRFARLIYAVLVYVIINLGSEIIEGNVALSNLTFFLNLLGFIEIDIVVIAFTMYLYALLNAPVKKKRKQTNVVFISCAVRIAVIFALTFTGHTFVIENGYYTERDLCFIPYAISLLVMLELLYIVLDNRKSFSTRQFVVVMLYELIPIPPIIIEYCTNLYSMTALSLTISVLLIYVLIQTVEIERARVRENVLEEISITDLLTGIGNRRAYYTKLAKLGANENIGVVFCDINKLKYVNDHFGHTAGDDLIKTFSSMLRTYYGEENSYRISGDEFVVIIRNSANSEFIKRCDDFRAAVERKDSISAMGVACGKGCCIEKLIAEAEEQMYLDKKNNSVSRTATAEE